MFGGIFLKIYFPEREYVFEVFRGMRKGQMEKETRKLLAERVTPLGGGGCAPSQDPEIMT